MPMMLSRCASVAEHIGQRAEHGAQQDGDDEHDQAGEPPG